MGGVGIDKTFVGMRWTGKVSEELGETVKAFCGYEGLVKVSVAVTVIGKAFCRSEGIYQMFCRRDGD